LADLLSPNFTRGPPGEPGFPGETGEVGESREEFYNFRGEPGIPGVVGDPGTLIYNYDLATSLKQFLINKKRV
jgi:hypothetical protein